VTKDFCHLKISQNNKWFKFACMLAI